MLQRGFVAFAFLTLFAVAVPAEAQPASRQSTKLTADQRAVMTQSRDLLQQAHERLAVIISECDGGQVMVIACTVPRSRVRCSETVAPCAVLDAFAAVNTGLARLDAGAAAVKVAPSWDMCFATSIPRPSGSPSTMRPASSLPAPPNCIGLPRPGSSAGSRRDG